jgi:hypothetical protein
MYWATDYLAFIMPDMRPGVYPLTIFRNEQMVWTAGVRLDRAHHSACLVKFNGNGYNATCTDGGSAITMQDLQKNNIEIGKAGGSVHLPGILIETRIQGEGPVFVEPFGPMEPALPRETVAPEVISPSKLQQLIAAVEDASFSDDKLGVVQNSANYNYYRCAQVVQILEQIDFGDTKIEALRILRPKIVDPENSIVLEKAFDFSSDKKKMRAMF